MESRPLPASAAAAANTLGLIGQVQDRLLAVHVGIDLADTYDWTAVGVCQVRERPRQGAALQAQPGQPILRESYFRVLQLRRWPHGMSVPELCSTLVGLLAGIRHELVVEAWYRLIGDLPPLRVVGTSSDPAGPAADPPGVAPRAVFADATGLGRPIVSMFADALRECPATADVWLHPLTFVHGERYDRARGVLGKTHLVANLQALLAAGRLELRKSDPELPTLLREIDAYRITISSDGRETFGAMSTSHDDLVTALALAVLDSGDDGPSWGPKLW